MDITTSQAEWKRGSAELLILSLVEARARHGYEISRLIEQRSEGAVSFYAASPYPLFTAWRSEVGFRVDGLKERATSPALLPADPAGTEGPGFSATRLADICRSNQPHHGG